ncbi:MAG: hypothetical protein R3E86_22590 [Pseudomonadales bacterium]
MSSNETLRDIQASIASLDAEYQRRVQAGQNGSRPLPASVARAYRLAISRQYDQLQKLKGQDGPR